MFQDKRLGVETWWFHGRNYAQDAPHDWEGQCFVIWDSSHSSTALAFSLLVILKTNIDTLNTSVIILNTVTVILNTRHRHPELDSGSFHQPLRMVQEILSQAQNDVPVNDKTPMTNIRDPKHYLDPSTIVILNTHHRHPQHTPLSS